MQPFFKSSSGSIIPFENVACVYLVSEICNLGIRIKSGLYVDTFTFNSIEDKSTQLKNYENYLINQYKLKELL